MNYFVVNAFTSTPFAGNPATVCVPSKSAAQSLTTEHMLRLAGELSSVETAFVLPPTEPKTDFVLRFFTKTKENPFCGHATIAAAHVLTTEFGFKSNEFFFETKSGLVIVKRSSGKFFELNLRPTLPREVTSQWGAAVVKSSGAAAAGPSPLEKVLEALSFADPKTTALSGPNDDSSVAAAPVVNASPAASAPPLAVETVRRHLIAALYHESSKNLILLFDAAWLVVAARPNFTKLSELTLPEDTNKVTITAVPRAAGGGSAPATPTAPTAAGPSFAGAVATHDQQEQLAIESTEAKWRKYDFITRLFAPWFNINEDAVSGASHAILAKVWREHDVRIRDKQELCCFQPSPRGGEILLDVHDADRIGVSGEAVTVAHGTTAFVKARL